MGSIAEVMQNHAKKRFKNTTSASAMTAIAISAMLFFSVAGMKAFADTIENTIVADVTKNTIVEGGSTTATYWIKNGDPADPQNSCNANDGTPVTITIKFPSGVKATVGGTEKTSPFELTFNRCGQENGKDVTFSSSTAGSYSIQTTNIVDNDNTNPIGTYTDNSDFTLTVTADTTNPTISITSPNDGAIKDTNSFTVSGTASDSGSGLQKVEVKIDSGSYSTATGTSSWSFDVTNYPEGTHTITAKATDKAGNFATTSIDVTYTPPDTTAPTLKLPADITEEATSASGAVVSYTVTATDDRDPSPSITCTPASGSTFPLGSTTVNCEAQDKAGNKATGSFTVTVQDRAVQPPIGVDVDILREIIAGYSRSLKGADLRGKDFRGAYLHGRNLSKAKLGGSNLEKADLCRSNLKGANLVKANLRAANLYVAELSKADLSNADLSYADLTLIDLSNAKLISTNLENANLSKANLSKADLSNAKLLNANLHKANLSDARVSAKDLYEARITGKELAKFGIY